MKTAICVALLAVLLAGCGVKRPLMRPSEIPAYEEKRARKRQQIEQERLLPPDPLVRQVSPEDAE